MMRLFSRVPRHTALCFIMMSSSPVFAEHTNSAFINLFSVQKKANLSNLLVEEQRTQNLSDQPMDAATKKNPAVQKQNVENKPSVNVEDPRWMNRVQAQPYEIDESQRTIELQSVIETPRTPETQRTAMRQKIGTINCLSQFSLNLGQILVLLQAVEKAVCFNPDTNGAWVQTKVNAAQLGQAKSSYYPQITSNANFDWGKDDYQVKDRQDLSYDTNTRRYGLTIQANWLLYDFGARKAQVDEAEKLLAMSLAQNNQILQDVILKTVVAYYQIMQYELKSENLQHLVSLAQENFKIAHARYQAGVGIKSDELQMSANLAKAQSDLTKLKGELKVAKGNLATIMGEPAYQDFKIDNTLKVPALLNLKSIHRLIEQSSQINPKFKAARFAVEAAQAKVKSVQFSQYPAVTLISNFNDAKQLGESPFANDSQRIQAGVQISLPLFDGFNHQYQVKAAQENLKLRQLAEEQLKLQNNADIWKSYNELLAMHENLVALTHLNESATSAYEVVQGRYKAGVGNMLEVINAQNVYIEARLNYATAMTDFLVIRYQLLANIGNLNIWSDENNMNGF